MNARFEIVIPKISVEVTLLKAVSHLRTEGKNRWLSPNVIHETPPNIIKRLASVRRNEVIIGVSPPFASDIIRASSLASRRRA